MTVRITGYEIRYRPADDDDADWLAERVPPTPNIALTGLQSGVLYLFEARSIGGNGRSSDWVPVLVTVPETNRTGALALPTNVIGNRASMWNVDTSVTYAATSPAAGASSATISVSAGTLVIGGSTIAYGASSATVTGTAGTSKIVYLYYDDPRMQGGSRVLGVADNVVESANVDGRIAVTSLKIDFPAAGGSGGGGGGIGGGGGGGGANNPVANQVIA